MTDTPFLPFARPDLSDDAINEVVDCLKSGWITTGPRVARFEEMLSRYHGGRKALAVSSATAGLHLALLALGLEDGDEVITTPLTFVATLNTIVLAGGRPVLVDIEEDSLSMDMNRLEDAVTPRTKAILPVHFAGRPVDLDPLYEIAEKHGLRVIEDCAHAIGAAYRDRRIGSFGDIQVMSFHPNKNMTTGEGGVILTDDEALAGKIERLRFHGIDRSAFNRFSKDGSQEYDVIAPGFKYNMMDIQAALGLHQLPALDGFINRRSQLATRYFAGLARIDGLKLPAAPASDRRHAWHLFTVLIRENHARIDRNGFMAAMKERGIGTGLHYSAVHLYSWYAKKFGWAPDDFPIAADAGNRICSLPLFPTLEEADQSRVIETIGEIFAATDQGGN